MSKVKNLPSVTTLADEDLLYAVDDSAGVNGGVKITKANLKANLALSAAEIKTLYESNLDTNALTDIQNFKIDDIKAIAQTVIVQKDPSSTQFSDIQAAIDSITDASSVKPYIVEINAGVYNINNTITLKPFVHLCGSGVATCITILDETKPVIIGSYASSLSNLELAGSGVGITNVALVEYFGNPNTTAFRLTNISFGNCHTQINITTNPLQPAIVSVRDCYYRGSRITKGFSINGTGFGLLYIFGYTINTSTSSENITKLFEVEGPVNTLFLNSCSAGVSGLSSGADCVNISNGGIFQAENLGIQGFDTGIKNENIGSGSNLIASSITILDSISKDLNILNPNTVGFVGGTFEGGSKVFIDATSTLSTTHTHPLGGFTSVGRFTLGDDHSKLYDAGQLIQRSPTMGLYSGGVLSDGGGLNINVSDGFGYFEIETPTHYVADYSWTNLPPITVTDNQGSYIYINNSEVLSASVGLPDTDDVILLGRVVAKNGVIFFIDHSPLVGHHFGNRSDEYFRQAIGSIYVSGSICVENTIPFKLDVNAGSYFFSVNHFAPSGGIGLTFEETYRAGGSFVHTPTTIIQKKYDNNTGVLLPVPASKFAMHSLYVIGEGAGEKYFVVYGQVLFNSLAEAQGGDIPTPPINFTDGVTLISTIIVDSAGANIIEIRDQRPILGFKASGVSASGDHSGLTGLLNDDHPQYFLTNGGRPLGGNLDMGTNNINNMSTVNGVVVENHKARHLPNGADAIATAAPVTVPIGAVNSIGVANALSRADHVHNFVVNNVYIDSNVPFSTTSLTPVIVTGFTLTPPAGTYIAIASFDVADTGDKKKQIDLGLYKAGFLIPSADRKSWSDSAGQYIPSSIVSKVTFTGIEAIDLRVNMTSIINGNIATVGSRSLTLIKVG